MLLNKEDKKQKKIFFYLDYRDCNSTCQFDISIKYDNINGLYYAPQLTFNYVHFNEGAILTHWDIDNCSPRCVHDLPDFWQNCLVIIPDENNHPHLVWGPYPFDANFPQADGYKIFRKVDNSDWGPITTTDNDIFEFIDDDFIIASMRTWHYLYYKIAAYYTENNNYHQSGFSNTCYVETPPQGGVGSKRGGYFNSKNSKNFSTTLYQNYPNPFNPTTNIKFQIKEKGYVRLKVFNMLGREVAVLVSEIKEPGKYTLQFNANNLPSGIYIYSLKVNDFIQNHKMILLK